MMHSSRRFREIRVGSKNDSGNFAAIRIVAIVKKFKKHLKILVVLAFPQCLQVISSLFFGEISDVVELSLMAEFDHLETPKKFNKLTATTSKVITKVLENTPDDSLAELNYESFSRYLCLKNSFQKCFNRQTKIRKLGLPESLSPNLEHLNLEKLFLYSSGDDENAALLKSQPALRHLCCNFIGSTSFDEVKKMQNLEVLSTKFSKNLNGELKNLKELEINLEGSILSQVLLPNLVKLIVSDVFLKSKHFEDLSHSATNLQYVEIRTPVISFLPSIIENFPALKTLHVELESLTQDLSFPTPTRSNLSLEELIIRKYHWPTVIGSLFDVINACPNLKRIQIRDVSLSMEQVTSLILNHPHLTHLWLGAELGKLNNNNRFSDTFLRYLIRAFKNSQDFIYLMIGRIAERNDQRMEDLRSLVDDDDRVTLRKVNVPKFGTCNLTLKKKKTPHSRDPFENFHEKQMKGFFTPKSNE